MPITPEELIATAKQAQALGAEIDINPEELQAYYPDVDEASFYLPAKPKPGFYFDAPALRKLTTVDPHVFRRLLNIE